MTFDSARMPEPAAHAPPPLPAALISVNPLRWVTIFGPGAIVASLTIGTGELIFSSRGGAIFGYRILLLFLVVSLFKWTLVYSTARHMVLTGVHPFQRWMALPIGPRGWLPAVMFVFAVVCLPIWVSFHASVLGDLLAGLTGTRRFLNGATVHLWGSGVLLLVVAAAFAGGYAALERIQLAIVGLMLLAVCTAVVLLKPDWSEILWGTLWPQRLDYPPWLVADARPAMQQIAARPVWVEASLYVGVIGGASYDYLAYTSFLREKRWGMAGAATLPKRLEGLPEQAQQSLRRWLRAPLIDCTLSFVVVFIFSGVFVTSGKMLLAPQQQIPGDGNFLDYQAQFVTQVHPWLYPLYIAGTLLTMLGTLYGTLEVGPTILREAAELLPRRNERANRLVRLRRTALAWSAAWAAVVLAVSFVYQAASGVDKPPGLTKILIPANLFTGVLSCGIICLLNPWMDRSLPPSFRPPLVLRALNLLAGTLFVLLGLKGYWDHSVWAPGLLLLTLGLGVVVAMSLRTVLSGDQTPAA